MQRELQSFSFRNKFPQTHMSSYAPLPFYLKAWGMPENEADKLDATEQRRMLEGVGFQPTGGSVAVCAHGAVWISHHVASTVRAYFRNSGLVPNTKETQARAIVTNVEGIPTHKPYFQLREVADAHGVDRGRAERELLTVMQFERPVSLLRAHDDLWFAANVNLLLHHHLRALRAGGKP